MNLIWEKLRVCALLAVAAGCAAKSQQQPDVGGHGGNGGNVGSSGSGGVSTAVDAGQDQDVALDAPADRISISGRRSFVVTALMQATDGGAANPASQKFTVVLDADQGTVIAGTDRPGGVATFEQTPDGSSHVVGPLSFFYAAGCSALVTFDELTFALDASGRLTGTGTGQQTVFNPPFPSALYAGDKTSVVMTLLGIPDTEAPRLNLVAGGALSDPFAGLGLSATEPLPPGAQPALVSAGGESIVLPPDWNTSMGAFVSQFTKPATTMLRYATQYSVRIDGISDFAGNPATEAATFQTGPPPPLLVDNGFESVTTTTYGGAQVLSAPQAPTIAGSRSLYVSPGVAGASPATLALRVPVAPGATALVFSYQVVNPRTDTIAEVENTKLFLGIEGGVIEGISVLAGGIFMATSATIAGTSVTLGPVKEMRVAIPSNASEVVLGWKPDPTTCGFAGVVSAGMIIDDLRTE